MSEFITFYIYKFTNILLAPLYFHFGHHWFFIETMVALTNLVDTLGLYFIMFFFIVLVCIYRNATFQTFMKNFFRTYLDFSNLTNFPAYFRFWYVSVFNMFSHLIDVIFSFFKKKK